MINRENSNKNPFSFDLMTYFICNINGINKAVMNQNKESFTIKSYVLLFAINNTCWLIYSNAFGLFVVIFFCEFLKSSIKQTLLFLLLFFLSLSRLVFIYARKDTFNSGPIADSAVFSVLTQTSSLLS